LQSAEPPSAGGKRAIEKKMTELASRVEARAARETDSSLLADTTCSSTAVTRSAGRISAASTVALSPGLGDYSVLTADGTRSVRVLRPTVAVQTRRLQ